MKIILSHPTGNQNVRMALDGFLKANMLLRFYTSIATFEDDIFSKIGKGPLKDFQRRQFHSSLRNVTNSYPLKEMMRLLCNKAGLNRLVRHEKGVFSVDAVYRYLDTKTANNLKKLHGLSAVYAYEYGAETSFIKAKQLGLKCYYDLPTGYWRAAKEILQREKEVWPDWASTMGGLKDSEEKYQRKDNELKLADTIFVASKFTADTLQHFPGRLNKIKIIPYGFPDTIDKREYSIPYQRRLKILFVGGLSQQKGIANLFNAVNKFKDKIELTIVGRMPISQCKVLNHELKKHKWIPSLPHEEILEIMRQHDIFVFPSIFDGFGLVITEAMSQGTPVIATERSAGPELISDSVNGWLTTAGNTESLENAIEKILCDPLILKKAGKEAIQTAKNRPWKLYGEELAASVLQTYQEKN